MDLILHNPIADLYGPYFLLLYGLFVVAVLVGIRFWIASHDSSDELDPFPIPSNPDPHEIAYLRGGVNELIRVVVFDLIQREILEQREESDVFGLNKKSKIARVADNLSPSTLTPLEKKFLSRFSVPREAKDVFDAGFTESVEIECVEFKRRLEAAQLLPCPEQKAATVGARFAGGALIAGLGGYKFCVALANGHYNVAFLVIMGLVSLIVLGVISRDRRVSRRGKRFLDDVQRAFERLKTRAVLDSSKTEGPNGDLVLVCALFGVSALASTPYAYYRDMFTRGGSCGSSFGSGCGAGCGGGGGCGGGCGGGGCGGCGG